MTDKKVEYGWKISLARAFTRASFTFNTMYSDAQTDQTNVKTEAETSQFHRAVKQGDEGVVKRLLDEGVNPDDPNWEDNGRLPLLEAVQRQHVNVVGALLRACCSVDVTTFQGETALHLAVESGPLNQRSARVIAMLLDAGADPGIPDRLTGNTALHALAAKHASSRDTDARQGALAVLRSLVDQCDVNARNFGGCTALHRAVAASSDDRSVAERVHVLVDGGADVNVQNNLGETSLHLATDANLERVVNLLVEGGADVNLGDRYRMGALHYAAIKGCREIARTLVEREECDVNATDLNGDTPLHLAAGRGRVEVVRCLTASGRLDVNVTNGAGVLAIHKAIESGFTDVVEELLRVNCELLVHTGYGLTPLDLACTESVYRTRPEISQLLLRAAQNTVEDCGPDETDI